MSSVADTPFTIASTVDEALAALAVGARPVAGGTDLVVGARQGKSPLPPVLVALDRIPKLAAIDQGHNGGPDGVSIGAMVTHARLMTDPVIVSQYTALADAAALVGSPATRNVGTLGGNVMNGSPAMDTGAPLVVLDADVELQSVSGQRRVSPLQLWTGPGETSAAANELCVACHLPQRPDRSGSAYVRLEYRRAMEIAVVGAAAAVVLSNSGELTGLKIALTAVAPTIVAVDALDGLLGRPVDDQLLSAVAAAASEHASPISDLRASADYRSHCVGVMARRAVDAATRRAKNEQIPVPVNRAEGIGRAERP